MPRRFLLLVVLLALGSQLATAQVVPTRLRVRVVSRDAKVVGTGVGGAQVTVRDVRSGEILARGVQLGGTGDTGLIMREPHARGSRLYDTEGTAYFETVLMLSEPTHVEVSAEGPLNFPESLQHASKTTWLFPGEDIGGEGLILELHGFIVQIHQPSAKRISAGQPIEVRAQLNMT